MTIALHHFINHQNFQANDSAAAGQGLLLLLLLAAAAEAAADALFFHDSKTASVEEGSLGEKS